MGSSCEHRECQPIGGCLYADSVLLRELLEEGPSALLRRLDAEHEQLAYESQGGFGE